LVGLSAVPHELVNLQLGNLPETLMITASNYMFVVLSMVYVVHAKEDERETSVLVKKIKYSAQQNVIKNTSRCKNMENLKKCCLITLYLNKFSLR
jgi:hypothetical protein